ncbi:DUF1036 domain-containing protein [Undibacter mobilis]|uniref:DUF1036 domain-containing protein n=1 Tax=Undibacter mobilis TaxID=2292256 RepID=A0A371BAA6_9BRAD|nr:DUF1036 domain-containing protein [Undibacter mobilis]RDV04494.1 DUF1036 domain-containing protein [Undibacter mobilis]
MIRRLIAGFLAAAAVFTVTAARAELTLCNRTSYRMDVALGLERRAMVETRGWFAIDPGQCKQVLDGAYDADMSYIHARTPAVYGSSPLPRSGNADFCVRESTFQIADGRGCPISQQVRFTASRPSDSPKGPVINLAEEADYDDAQARLAGIQRLLVIAGYDANPIDGIQGGKTQAAIAKFLADRKLPADAANGADFFATLLAAAQNPEGHGFTWCNDTTYPVMAAIGTLEAGAIVTRGWYRVESGQCVRPEMRGDQKKLYSYAEAVDDKGAALKKNGVPLAWGGDVALCTRDGRFELADNKDCAARGLNSANYAEVDLTKEPAATVRFKEP